MSDYYRDLIQISKSSITSKSLAAHIDNKLGLSRYVKDSKFVAKLAKNAGVVLDLGCGQGHISYLLAKQGCNVVASEVFDEEPIYISKFNSEDNENTIEYLPTNILNPNHALEGRKFDIILLYGVLEHVPNFSLFLNKASELLTENGDLVIYQFPNRYSFFEKLNETFRKTSHDIRLSKQELRLLLNLNTFSVKEMKYHQFLPYNLNNFPTFIRKFYYSLGPLIRVIDSILYTIPIVSIFSTSIYVRAKKSLSVKS